MTLWQRFKLWFKPRRERELFLAMGGGRNVYRSLRVEPGSMSMEVGTTVAGATDQDLREEVEPVEVLRLLEEPVKFSIEALDEKITKLEDHALLAAEANDSVPGDVYHAIQVLKARRRYNDVAHEICWPTTTQQRIDELCTKYKLRHGSAVMFLPGLPAQALREMSKYRRAVYDKVVKKGESLDPRPDYSLIAKPQHFRTERKGDPILLAKSPFGEFFYVLCAWDEEVNIVEELLA